MKLIHKIAFVSIFVITISTVDIAVAQDQDFEKSPAGALLRSMVLPGWGQYYVDQTNWSRGKIHLLTDVALIGTYLGIQVNTHQLESNRNSFALSHAGIDLRQHNRNIRIYVGDFDSLDDFNDFQERTRNWNLIIDASEGIHWSWNNESLRNEFTSLNSRIDQQKQQLPALLTLMLVNRVIAGIHAYTQAMNYGFSNISLTVTQPLYPSSFQANLRVTF
ncbi:MAG: hypothetical protein JJU41_02205 [Bacteroidetes bacterium]|nr:hypothetical protein [Bacteroidota bacterium]